MIMAAYDGLYETAHNLVIFILDGAAQYDWYQYPSH
jgi:hypothetical protein